MTPYSGGSQIGPEEFVSYFDIQPTADRMFSDGADEVRVTRPHRSAHGLRGVGMTRKSGATQKRKRKAQKRARRANR